MKIVILCSGLEHRKDRGYENASKNLLQNLRNEKNNKFEVLLYKGSGEEADDEIVLSSLVNLNVLHKLGIKLLNDFYGLEYAQFALQFLLHAMRKNLIVDTIYTQEPRVAKTLYKLKKYLPGNPTLVYGMGINLTAEHYINVSDKVHLVNVEHLKEALNAYPASKKFFLIPNALSENKIHSGTISKAELRKKYNIKTPNVLLSVGAINAGVKRMDYVVKEAAKLDKSWSLVICGKTQETHIIDLGKHLLGERFINILLPPDKVSEMYAMADLSVLSSIIEGFGNVTVEAMQNSLPVLLHKRELNKWIVEDDELLIDMTEEGAMAATIKEKATEEWLSAKGESLYKLYKKKFRWEAIKPKYYELLNIN